MTPKKPIKKPVVRRSVDSILADPEGFKDELRDEVLEENPDLDEDDVEDLMDELEATFGI